MGIKNHLQDAPVAALFDPQARYLVVEYRTLDNDIFENSFIDLTEPLPDEIVAGQGAFDTHLAPPLWIETCAQNPLSGGYRTLSVWDGIDFVPAGELCPEGERPGPPDDYGLTPG